MRHLTLPLLVPGVARLSSPSAAAVDEELLVD
jgi:hypothetical protein